MSICAYCTIDTPKARAMLSEVERAVANWRECGRQIGMTTIELDQFADAFEHPEREAARKIIRAATQK